MRIACLLVGLLFLVSAALQWNDPDPWAWIAIYSAAGAISVRAWRGPVPRAAPLVVAAVAFVWMLALSPATFADFRVSDLARSMKAETPAIELSREWLGLLLIAAWMLAVARWRSLQKETARVTPGRP